MERRFWVQIHCHGRNLVGTSVHHHSSSADDGDGDGRRSAVATLSEKKKKKHAHANKYQESMKEAIVYNLYDA